MAKKNLIKDLRGMSFIDLTNKIKNLEEEYFRLRCTQKTGQLTDKSALLKTRRDIARIRTIYLERTKSEQTLAKN